MYDFIKNNFIKIILTIAIFVIGVVSGIQSQPDENGIYLSLNYPDGKSLFTVGKNIMSTSSLDLDALDELNAAVLVSKVSAITSSSIFGGKIRNLAKEGAGPFEPIPVKLEIHLVDNDSQLTGPVAKVCRNTPVFSNALIAYEVEGDLNLSKQGIMNIHAVREQLSGCATNNTNKYDLWLSRAYVQKWVGESTLSENNILVSANIILSNMDI